jgi:hypothetical protein
MSFNKKQAQHLAAVEEGKKKMRISEKNEIDHLESRFSYLLDCRRVYSGVLGKDLFDIKFDIIDHIATTPAMLNSKYKDTTVGLRPYITHKACGWGPFKVYKYTFNNTMQSRYIQSTITKRLDVAANSYANKYGLDMEKMGPCHYTFETKNI